MSVLTKNKDKICFLQLTANLSHLDHHSAGPVDENQIHQKPCGLCRVSFLTGPTQKVLGMELVPPNCEQLLSTPKIAMSQLKKWKSKSKPFFSEHFSAKFEQKMKVWQALRLELSLFSKGFFSIFDQLNSFSLLGGTGSILRIFFGWDQSKISPCSIGRLFIIISLGKLQKKSVTFVLLAAALWFWK